MLRSVVVSVSFLTLVSVSALMTFSATSAVTGDTEVRTVVCDGSASASLTIDSPASDTVLTTMPVTINGAINNITQIDITVNGDYAGTVPISATQTSYTTQLTINKGTHTIQLTGNDVCHVQNAVETVVVTFEPPIDTSGGGGEGTQPPSIGPITPGGTNQVDGQPVASGDEQQGIETIPVIGDIVIIAKKIAEALDFDATARDGGLYVTVARFSLFTVGVGLSLFGSTVLYTVRTWRLRDLSVREYLSGKKAALSDPKLRDHIHRNVFIVRGIGIILTCLAFLV